MSTKLFPPETFPSILAAVRDWAEKKDITLEKKYNSYAYKRSLILFANRNKVPPLEKGKEGEDATEPENE